LTAVRIKDYWLKDSMFNINPNGRRSIGFLYYINIFILSNIPHHHESKQNEEVIRKGFEH
jgi:hypothetical protein